MKSAKARILYLEAAAKVRANDWSSTVISVAAAVSKRRTDRDLARFPGPIRQYVRHWTLCTEVRGGDAEASLCVHLGFVSPPKVLVVGRVVRGETAGDLPKNCHLLPSAAILEPQNRYARCNRFIPFLPSRACRPGWEPRAGP
jgi:hypothetical protein